METKTCKNCKFTCELLEAPIHFHPISGRNPKNKSAYAYLCKKCNNELAKERIKLWRKANPGKSKENGKIFYLKNKERIRKEAKQKRDQNKDQFLEKERKQREKNKSVNELEKLNQLRWVKNLNKKDRFIYNKYKAWQHAAAKRKITFDLKLEDIYFLIDKQQGKCYYTDQPFNLEPKHDMTLSLDRINSDYGYTLENCVLCGSIINLMKLDLPVKDFSVLCRQICNHLEKILTK